MIEREERGDKTVVPQVVECGRMDKKTNLERERERVGWWLMKRGT